MIVMFEVCFVCEVELFYVLFGMVIDWDSWCEVEDVVEVVGIFVVMKVNVVFVCVVVCVLVEVLLVMWFVSLIDCVLDGVIMIVFVW